MYSFQCRFLSVLSQPTIKATSPSDNTRPISTVTTCVCQSLLRVGVPDAASRASRAARDQSAHRCQATAAWAGLSETGRGVARTSDVAVFSYTPCTATAILVLVATLDFACGAACVCCDYLTCFLLCWQLALSD